MNASQPTPTRHDCDVAVVGAGPVGLALALGLARRGVGVTVLEKEAGTAEYSRAPAIWPPTQAVLDELGVLEGMRQTGIELPTIRIHDADRGKVLVELPIEELADETPHPRLLILPQADTEQILCTAVSSCETAAVRFGCEVTELAADADGVVVHYRSGETEGTVRAGFVAGCDGAHSFVRHSLGATFAGTTYDLHAALADVVPDVDQQPATPRLSTRPNPAVAIRITKDRWRLILPFFGDGEDADLKERVTEAVPRLFGTAAFEPVWQSTFRVHRRKSDTWQKGRVVLAGDAAHLNSPVGGQGMNAGILDAAALTDAMAEAVATDDPGPLAAYAREREQQITTGVNRFTDVMTRLLMFGNGRFLRLMFRSIGVLLHLPPLRRRLLRRIAMLR